jgi:hypothetical protein
MFYPGSGSLNFSSRVLGVKKHRIPDPTVHTVNRGMKNKTNLFLSRWFQEQVLLEKIKTRILKIRDPEKIHPGSRG